MEKEEKISLYQIVDSIQKMEDYIESEEELAEYLDALNLTLEAKVSNIVRYSRSLELTSDAVSSEIDRLTQLRKYYDLRSQNLKNYLSTSLQKLGKESLETEVAKLSFRKSESVEIKDIHEIPAEYNVIKTTESADKTAIKKALKEGKQVEGAELISKLNLQIK